MAEFDYKQRPFSSTVTDEQYDRAVGKIPPLPSPRKCPKCGSKKKAVRLAVRLMVVEGLMPDCPCNDRWHNAR